MAHRIKFYEKKPHPVYGGIELGQPYINVDPREPMRVKPTRDIHKLKEDCEAEKQSNSISVRHLFEKKISRKERKKLHRK